MSIRDTVHAVIRKVAAQQGRSLAPLTDDLPLVNSGIDSLSFAIIVAVLEDQTNVDPFNTSERVDYPVTLGDFIKFYDRAAA